MASNEITVAEPSASRFYITNIDGAGSTITVGSSKPSTDPVRIKHVDARRTVDLELENSPYTVKAWEDEEGVRWAQIGCKKATLQRWRERGTRYIAAHSKDARERARLGAGLKVVLAALGKAFA